jgi:hypothetical protein
MTAPTGLHGTIQDHDLANIETLRRLSVLHPVSQVKPDCNLFLGKRNLRLVQRGGAIESMVEQN